VLTGTLKPRRIAATSVVHKVPLLTRDRALLKSRSCRWCGDALRNARLKPSRYVAS